jgi:hypothetical protein
MFEVMPLFSGVKDFASYHTSIFYHLYGEEWLCQTLGYRECKGEFDTNPK